MTAVRISAFDRLREAGSDTSRFRSGVQGSLQRKTGCLSSARRCNESGDSRE